MYDTLQYLGLRGGGPMLDLWYHSRNSRNGRWTSKIVVQSSQDCDRPSDRIILHPQPSPCVLWFTTLISVARLFISPELTPERPAANTSGELSLYTCSAWCRTRRWRRELPISTQARKKRGHIIRVSIQLHLVYLCLSITLNIGGRISRSEIGWDAQGLGWNSQRWNEKYYLGKKYILP